ncbi:hypothetical protein ANCDUO_04373 [Ancylostoma duodenale]|uniref:phosphoinositide phospholipase C n=1 Tax=Ancylostoma duodenale TaxID=51022 RepID=A0A0C2H769_9BILA|nr:hypothetical protein ANCDUO_04373 [Ancylostoma duodenale]
MNRSGHSAAALSVKEHALQHGRESAIHWMMGVQMVALNFQTNCPEMLMNHAMFEQTACSGGYCAIRARLSVDERPLDFEVHSFDSNLVRMEEFEHVLESTPGQKSEVNTLRYVKKPDCLNDPSLEFDIYSNHVPHRMPVTLKVTILSSMFLPPVEGVAEFSPYYVTMELFGMPPYDRASSTRVSAVAGNGIFVHFRNKQTVFEKIVLSETAFLQFCVYRRVTNGNPAPIAYRTLSINRLHNGYRHVILRTVGNQNLGPMSLFVYFDVFYYVMSTQITVHSALMNPFNSAKKEESLSMALLHPFAKHEEIVEDDAYRQAIVGTAKMSRDETPLPSPPPSPIPESFTSRAASNIVTKEKIMYKGKPLVLYTVAWDERGKQSVDAADKNLRNEINALSATARF